MRSPGYHRGGDGFGVGNPVVVGHQWTAGGCSTGADLPRGESCRRGERAPGIVDRSRTPDRFGARLSRFRRTVGVPAHVLAHSTTPMSRRALTSATRTTTGSTAKTWLRYQWLTMGRLTGSTHVGQDGWVRPIQAGRSPRPRTSCAIGAATRLMAHPTRHLIISRQTHRSAASSPDHTARRCPPFADRVDHLLSDVPPVKRRTSSGQDQLVIIRNEIGGAGEAGEPWPK